MGTAGAASGKALGAGITKSAKNSAKGISGIFSPAAMGYDAASMGKMLVGTLAAGVAIKGIVGFIGDSITAGSDLAESQSKVAVVFGQSAAAIESWAETSSTSVGLSTQAALEAAGTYGNLFQAFGIGQGAATEMSTTLVQLAADLASFNNTSVDEAIQALRSGLSGETEPLKRYGIALTDVRLKEEALAQGIYNGTGMLTAAQKAQAAYALALKDSSLASGDFERTGDGFANTMRSISAEVENAKAAIGTALVDAIMDAGDALGGSGGATSVIRTFGDETAELIRDVSEATQGMLSLTAAAGGLVLPAGSEGWINETFTLNNAIGAVGDSIKRTVLGPLGLLVLATQGSGDATAAATGEYVRMGPALTQVARQTRDLAAEEAAAKQRTDELTAAQQALNDLLSAAEGRLAFSRWLRDLDGIVGKNTISFEGFTEGARKNQDALISGFGLAEMAVKGWSAEAITAAGGFDAAFAGKAAKVVRQFVDDGFKLKDVRAFLRAQDLWTPELAAVFSKDKNAAAYAKALELGTGLGKDLAKGLAQGIVDGTPGAAANAKALVESAERAARAAAESDSPSRLFMRVGEDLSAGMAVGVKNNTGEAVGSIRELVKAMMDQARSDIASAKSAIASMSAGIVGDVLGGLDFTTTGTDAEGKTVPLTPAQIVSMFLGDIANQSAAAAAISAGIGAKLPPALLSQILAFPPDTAIALANYLAANPALTEQLAANYAALATQAQTTLGLPMGAAWAMVGDQSAKDMLAAARALIRGRSESFAAFVRDQLSTTITVGVRYVSAGGPDLPGRASGGPVLAGRAYMVGERGPEPFIPGVDGTILPHGSLDMASPAARVAAVAGVAPADRVDEILGEFRALRKEVRDQAERDRTMARTNGYR